MNAEAVDVDVSLLQPGVETAPPSASSTNPFSSPVREDEQIDGFLDHGSFRQNGAERTQVSFRGSIRRRSGRISWIGQPVTKIAEVDEDEHDFNLPIHADITTEMRRLSIGSNALTPLNNTLIRPRSAPPPSSQKKEVSFHLTPLPDLSYQFETAAALTSVV